MSAAGQVAAARSTVCSESNHTSATPSVGHAHSPSAPTVESQERSRARSMPM